MTTTSAEVKLVPTSSLKANVKVTGPVAVVAVTLSVIAKVGGVVSATKVGEFVPGVLVVGEFVLGVVIGKLVFGVLVGGASAAPPPHALITKHATKVLAASWKYFKAWIITESPNGGRWFLMKVLYESAFKGCYELEKEYVLGFSLGQFC